MGKWLTVQAIFERMGSELEEWKQQFLLLSPIEGRLSLTRFWSPQQFVQINETVATVVPENVSQKNHRQSCPPHPEFRKGACRHGDQHPIG